MSYEANVNKLLSEGRQPREDCESPKPMEKKSRHVYQKNMNSYNYRYGTTNISTNQFILENLEKSISPLPKEIPIPIKNKTDTKPIFDSPIKTQLSPCRRQDNGGGANWTRKSIDLHWQKGSNLVMKSLLGDTKSNWKHQGPSEQF